MRVLKFRQFRSKLSPALAVLFCLTVAPAFAASDMLFTGGGFIKDGKGAAAKRISFSVSLFVEADAASEGHLSFRFHNLDDQDGLDQSRFRATQFDSVRIATRYLETTPYTFVRIEASGKLNGADGWSVLARFSDFGVPVRNKALQTNHSDALRVILFDPSGVDVYDTALDFPREQSWRALLDGGNVAVDMRLNAKSR